MRTRIAIPGLRRAVISGAALTLLLYVVGADLLHCVLLGVVLFTVVVLFTALAATDDPAEPDALPVPYSTPVLRSFVMIDPQSPEPVGEIAGRRAHAIYTQALTDHPGDPLLASYASSPRERWRYLPQRDLVAMLDRIDALTAPAQEER